MAILMHSIRRLMRRTRRSDSCAGMTLIDMSIMLAVVGLIAVPIIQTYQYYASSKARGITEANMLAIDKAIDDFYFNNGRYPCPSNITLATNSPFYGRETTNCPTLAVTPGTTREGGVPFITLKIPESMSLDGWGNRLSYTVTERLRRPWGMPAPTGVITVHGSQFDGISCAPPQINLFLGVHYLVVSHGANGAGATPREGGIVPVQACPAAGALGSERENCDVNNDRVFYHSKCGTTLRAGLTFNDDVVSPSVRTTGPQRTWVYNTANTNNMVTSALNVGVNNPTPAFGLDVIGNIRADNPAGTNGNIISDEICDINGQNCFNPRAIGGGDPAMNCPNGFNGTSMGGIWDPTPTDPSGDSILHSSANCGTFLPATGAPCPAGQFITGFDASGVRICN